MQCVIPCAGESSRMAYMPKHLIQLNGKPLITHVVDTWKDSVDSFIFVLKRSMTYMWEYLPDNSAVVFQDEPKGLADAILRAEKYVRGKFVVALGDCIHRGTFEECEFSLGIGVWRTTNLKEINKSYLVSIGPDRLVKGVEEKPKLAKTNTLKNCGMGTYFFDRKVFNYIREYKGPIGGGDLTYILQTMVDAGENITPIMFSGTYVNVGSPEDMEKAEEVLSGCTQKVNN